MPIYQYEVRDGAKGCRLCKEGFERIESIKAKPTAVCPECGAPVARVPALTSVGRSESSFDDRAKAAGFSKLKRIGSGEYEKQY